MAMAGLQKKYERSHRRYEHCILSSVAFYVGRGTEYTLEELHSNQSNRRIGLERLSTLRYFH